MKSRKTLASPGRVIATGLLVVVALWLLWPLLDRRSDPDAAPIAAAAPSRVSGEKRNDAERAAPQSARVLPADAVPGDVSDARGTPANRFSEVAPSTTPAEGAIRILKFSDLSPADQKWILEENRRNGYFTWSDIKASGYDAYDTETVIDLARNGDKLAEFMVVSNMTTYPEEIRKEIAVASAALGRPRGLYVLGTEPFDFIDADAMPFKPVGWSPPTTERLVEGYGMMLAALQLGERMANHGLGPSFQTALERLTPEQIREAEQYASDLMERIQQRPVE